MLSVCTLVSFLVRFLLEVFSNLVLSPFRERIDWEKYWIESDCSSNEGTRSKLICKAYQICIQELIPSLIPMSMDDFWIQILIVIIMVLLVDCFSLASHRLPEYRSD